MTAIISLDNIFLYELAEPVIWSAEAMSFSRNSVLE